MSEISGFRVNSIIISNTDVDDEDKSKYNLAHLSNV